jgi:hypothetical protein
MNASSIWPLGFGAENAKREGKLSSRSNGGGRRVETLDQDRKHHPLRLGQRLKIFPGEIFRAKIPARSPVKGKAGVFPGTGARPRSSLVWLKSGEAVRQIGFGDWRV